ncbi:MAG: glycosyltransferase family 2 protein [Streptococcus sp.]|nr:MAG: glycosyltransferase family 2 protein [Streptococcus sp.]
MTKFSIVVPIYNVEEYIEDCVNSVLRQTYTNFELLLVNDASPDSSLAIITRLSKLDNRIIVIDKRKNEGVALARSTGLSQAVGNFVLYLDGDDQLVPEALEILSKKIQSNNPDIVIYPKIKECNGEKYVKPYFYEETLFSDNKKELLDGFLRYGYFVIGFAAIRRELALEYDFADELRSIWIGEDLLQSLPLLTYAQSILYITEGIYVITYNPNSVTRSRVLRKDRYLQAIKTHEIIEYYLTLWEIKELEETFQFHVMKDAIEYALEGIWSANNLKEGVEYLKTIGTDKRFIKSYSLGYPHDKKMRLIAFLLKNRRYTLVYYLIKIKERIAF